MAAGWNNGTTTAALAAMATEDNQTLFTRDAGEDVAVLQAQLDSVRFAVQKILLPLIAGFGVVGNCMNTAVLTRKWMKSSTNHYLTVLALCDILYLVFAMSLSLKHYESIRGQHWYGQYRLPYGRPLVDIFSNTGVWLTLTFTIERYISVVHPMKGKLWCTPRRAKRIIAVVCAAAAAITFPEFFASRAAAVTKNNVTVISISRTALGKSNAYVYGFVYTNQVLFTFLPLVLLLVFNTLLILTVLNAARQRRSLVSTPSGSTSSSKSGSNMSEQQRITIMLISVIFVFLVCQTPQAMLNIYVSYLTSGRSGVRNMAAQRIRVIIGGNFCNLLVMINSSCNFILYSAFSAKFRATFKTMFCACVYGKGVELRSAPGGAVSDVRHGSRRPSDKGPLLGGHRSRDEATELTRIQSKTKIETRNGYLKVPSGGKA